LTPDEFRNEYLDVLQRGQEYDLYGYKPAGVSEYLQTASASAVSIIRMRAEKRVMSTQRCHKVMRSKNLWELTTDDGARFLYFQDGPRQFIFVSATEKMKEKKFHIEIERAEQLRLDYLRLKEGKLK
jgi:hypothetical protein